MPNPSPSRPMRKVPSARPVVAGALCLFAMLLAWQPTAALAQAFGDLSISPSRLTFEGRARTDAVTLLNRGDTTTTYRVSVVNMRMTEDGRFEEIHQPDPGQNFADSLIRFSPRQVTLRPGETQLVRVVVRKPRDLPAGEYRSHFFFQAIPSAEEVRNIETVDSATGLQINLAVIPGVTIPVIVRQGEIEAAAALSELRLVEAAAGQEPKLSLRIDRNGERSLFGDLTAVYRAPGSAREEIVAQATRLAVYTPNESRRVELPLRRADDASLRGGRLRVVYRTRPEEGAQLIAEGELALP